MTSVTLPPCKPDESSPVEAQGPTRRGLRHLVDRRRVALLALAEGADEEDHDEIQLALAAIDGLVSGNLDAIPEVIAGELARWISTSRPMGANLLRKAQAELRRKSAVVHQAAVEASEAIERKAAADQAVEEHAQAEQALLRELGLAANHDTAGRQVPGGRM